MIAAPPQGFHGGRRVFSESVWYIAIDSAQNLLALLVVPVSLWWLTPADMGTVTLVLIGTQIAMTIASGGLDFAVIRYYLTWPEGDRAANVAGACMLVVAASALIVTAAVVAAPSAGSDGAALLAAALAGAALGVRSIPLAVFRVTSDLVRFGAVVIAGSLLQAVLQIGALLMGWGLVGFLFGASSAAVLSGVIAFVLLLQRHPLRPVRRPSAELLRVGGWVLVSSLANRLVSSADRFAVAWWGTRDALGVYGTAAKWSMPLRMVSGGAKMAIAPALSRTETEGNLLDAVEAPIAALVTLLALFAALLQLSSLALLLTPWQSLVAEFQRLLSVLLAAQVGASLALIGQLLLYYVGRPAHSAALSVVSAIVTLGGLVWLVPQFGALGAAVSQLGASVVLLIVLGLIARRMAWVSRRSARAIAALAAALAAPWLLPIGTSAVIVAAGTAVLAWSAWGDLRSTVGFRRLAG